MKSAGGWQWVVGPFVVAGSIMLGVTIVLFSTHQMMGLNAAVWLPQMLGGPINYSSPRALPFYNITGKIMEEIARNGTGHCYDQNTNSTKVIGFPDNDSLSTNVVHKFWLQSYTRAGERRCAGGDYYELDLSSPLWKSRPPSKDLQNGTYAVQFMVPDVYAGDYTFSAFLLFDAYHGLDYNGETWSIKELTASLRIKFVTPEANSNDSSDNLQTLKRCESKGADFQRHEWSGRWSRPQEINDSCIPNAEGRYLHCFPNNIPCRNPSWCSGNVETLESLGWSYSAHCTFHIFQPQEAWDCLAGRWLFFWGDSNHQDTIRNLLTFILQIRPPPGRDLRHFAIDRSYQNWFRNPANLDQELRISSHYNGHPMVDSHGIGLACLENPHYRDYVTNFFRGKRYPDTVIMNSGLHDGWHQQNVATYTKTVDMALQYWSDLFRNLTGGKVPELVYRTTIAPAGASRGMQSNAQKMEVFNRIATEQVQQRFPQVKLVDAFDMSFSFHYDNNYSDGGHYGRPPDADQPHFYFVDVMLAHVLLNALCPNK